MSQTITTTAQSPPRRPASVARTVILAGLALVGSGALTHYLSGIGSEQFSGALHAESIELTADIDGVVELVTVKPGQIVYPDDQLFVVRSSDHVDQIASAQQDIQRLVTKLKIAEAGYRLELDQILSDMDTEIHDIQSDLAQLEGERFQLTFRDTAFSDFLGITDDSVATSDSTDLMRLLRDAPDPALRLRVMMERGRIENDLDTKQARIDLATTRLSRLQSGQKELPAKVRAALGIPAVEAELTIAREHVADLQNIDNALAVSAPAYGMAGLVRVSSHDAVQRGQTLLQVFDRSRESIQVELPGRLVPELKADREVSLIFPGGELRTGRIETIPPQVSSPATADRESQIAVTIRPSGRVWPTLPIGTSVSVSLETL